MALIEIDGLPIKNGGSFHGELLVITHNQMVSISGRTTKQLRPWSPWVEFLLLMINSRRLPMSRLVLQNLSWLVVEPPTPLKNDGVRQLE